MPVRVIFAVSAGAAFAASGLAQTGTATYSIAFGSPTGPNSVRLQPGETVHVFVCVAFTPVYPPLNVPVAGLSDGAFSISGSGSGAGSWSVDPASTSPTYSLPDPWGAQSTGGLGASVGSPGSSRVAGAAWGYGILFSLPHPFPQNPANVWRGSFTASSVGVIKVGFFHLGITYVFPALQTFPTTVMFQSSPRRRRHHHHRSRTVRVGDALFRWRVGCASKANLTARARSVVRACAAAHCSLPIAAFRPSAGC